MTFPACRQCQWTEKGPYILLHTIGLHDNIRYSPVHYQMGKCIVQFLVPQASFPVSETYPAQL